MIVQSINSAIRGLGDAIEGAWAKAMAGILRTTERTMGPILRLFGVTAETMAAMIAANEDYAKSSFEMAESSFRGAWGGIQQAFEDVGKSTEEATEGALKFGAAVDDAGKAADELKHKFDAFEGRANSLVDKYFPGEAARAHELMGLLDQFGDKLDDFQRKAVETRIDEMFLAAALGVRRLVTKPSAAPAKSTK